MSTTSSSTCGGTAAEIPDAEGAAQVQRQLCRPARFMLIAFGWLNVGLGLAGLFLPVMPTTVFLLIALWAFSRSSARFHRWLYDHPRLGRPLRDWHAHRVIPARAKAMALGMMTLSLVAVGAGTGKWWLTALVLLCLMPVALFIATRPSAPPAVQA